MAAALLALAACSRPETARTALIGATVIDGTGSPPRADQVVLIRGATIERVGPRVGFRLPRGTRKVDVSGRWIVPGLIDAHVRARPWSLPRFLAAGVTTVRDLHEPGDSILPLARQSAQPGFPGPRIYAVGAALDHAPAIDPEAVPVPTPDSARRVVDALVLAGVDQLKTLPRMGAALIAAIVDEAAAFGLGVAAHLGVTDAAEAARLGVRTQEHLSGIPEAVLDDPGELVRAHREGRWPGWTAAERTWAGLDSARLAGLAAELARRKVILVPTLIMHDTYARLDDTTVYGAAALAAVPAAERMRWDLPDLVRRAGWTPQDYPRFRAGRLAQDRFLRDFRAAGGRVAVGTDAGDPLLVPGAALHAELALLVQAGLTPMEALVAATAGSAGAIDADSLGRVAAGKVADLLVLDSDPLADIRNLAAIDRVVLRGRFLRPDSIRTAW